MFAHQVIEDLKQNRIYKHEENNKKYLIRDISTAQKFHFGEIDSLINIFSSELKERPLLFSKNMEQYNIPYNICWFDYGDITKLAFLIIKDLQSGYINCMSFTYFKEINCWWLSPWRYVIILDDVGKTGYQKIGFCETYKPDRTLEESYDSIEKT